MAAPSCQFASILWENNNPVKRVSGRKILNIFIILLLLFCLVRENIARSNEKIAPVKIKHQPGRFKDFSKINYLFFFPFS
jgi:hypothetical protein